MTFKSVSKPLTPVLPDEKNLESPLDINSNHVLIEAALADKAAFARWPLGYDLPKHQEDWCDLIQDHKNLVCLAPAGHGKTTIFSIANSIHEVTKNRSVRVGIVTNSDDLGLKIMREIKWHLEFNENLINNFGRFKSPRADKWSRWDIQVENHDNVLRRGDTTVSVMSAMSHIKGKRFDLLLGDDIVDEKNSKTHERCDALWDWLWGTLIPRMESDKADSYVGIKFMGTVENESDMYHRFLENNRGFHVARQQAIVDENAQKVLWPERLGYEFLTNLRAANYVQFMKTYQNTVVGSEVAKISPERIEECYDGSRKMLPTNIPPEIRQRYKLILMAVDPAWTKHKRSKYSVITTVGLTYDDRREVIDIFRDQVEYQDLFNWIKNKYHSLLPHLVLVESNNMQDRLRQEVQEAGIPTKAVFTSASKNDADVGIPMLYAIISQRKLSLPTGDQQSDKLSRQAINEILSYPHGNYSDIMMTLYFCEREIRARTMVAKFSPESAVSGRVIGRKFSQRYGLWR